MRIFLVDDEPPARRRLARLLAEDETLKLVGEADCGEEALAMIPRLRPDVILLDISLPDMSGFRVLEHLNNRDLYHVIFVTAHDDKALAAFEAQALDYLVKPVRADRLAQAIARVKRLTHSFERQLRFDSKLVHAGEIRWAEAARNYVVVHAGENYIVRSTLDALASRLDPGQFVRVSRSHLINVDSIAELQPLTHGERRIVLRDGTSTLWTRRYRESLEAYLSRVASR